MSTIGQAGRHSPDGLVDAFDVLALCDYQPQAVGLLRAPSRYRALEQVAHATGVGGMSPSPGLGFQRPEVMVIVDDEAHFGAGVGAMKVELGRLDLPGLPAHTLNPVQQFLLQNRAIPCPVAEQ